MADSKRRRWILLVLFAIGVAVVAMIPRGATEDSEPATEAPETSDTAAEPTGSEVTGHEPEAGSATKRVIEGCEPIAEALRYEEFIDRRALAVLRWNNLAERAAKLKIPVYVKRVDDGVVSVSILEIPMRDQYLTIWQNSGHLRPAADGTFLLDPCAAWIEPWEAMDRANARDAE